MLTIITQFSLDYSQDFGDYCASRYLPWCCSIVASVAVILAGILPVLIIPKDTGLALHRGAGLKKLNLLLSFAVGSLLGDVFLHLLPESWHSSSSDMLSIGLWVLAGLLFCVIVEKSCSHKSDDQHRITAMMNLVANFVDNFTHGLAVGGSFLVNIRFGLLTTLAILIHEIPHEIGDFAILLRADFERWDAVKAQLCTSIGGIIGALFALMTSSQEQIAMQQNASNWILPFTAGGFLNIALVQVLPDLLNESNAKESLKQCIMLLSGIGIMAVLNFTMH